MFNPLPALAPLSLALLSFGFGETRLLFVPIEAVVRLFAIAELQRFESLSETHGLVGRNYRLTARRYVRHISSPSALPALISGMRIGRAFACRT